MNFKHEKYYILRKVLKIADMTSFYIFTKFELKKLALLQNM